MAESIRSARRDAGLTLRQLGAAAGVSESPRSQIENRRARRSPTALYTLATGLAVSLDEVPDPAAEAVVGDVDVTVVAGDLMEVPPYLRHPPPR